MNKKTIITIIFAVATLTADAQFLFRIGGGGLTEPSYMLGTIHYLPGSLLDNSAEYQEAMAQCRQMYVERIPAVGKTVNQQQSQARPTVTYQDGKNIFDVIDAESAAILKEKFMEALNIDLDDPKWKDCWNWTPAVYYNLLVSRLKSQTTDGQTMLSRIASQNVSGNHR